jgi:hypothetical protein
MRPAARNGARLQHLQRTEQLLLKLWELWTAMRRVTAIPFSLSAAA